MSSIFIRFGRPPAQERTAEEDDQGADGCPEPMPGDDTTAEEGDGGPGGALRRWRRVAAWATTALAALLVLFVLLAPTKAARLTPGEFVRIPVEAVLGVVLVVILPPRARRAVAALAGVGLGLLFVLKALDMGFNEFLLRPFDPVFDWSALGSGVEFLDESVGRAGAIGVVIAVAVLIVGVVVLMTLAVRRLTRLVVRHNAAATGGVAVAGTAWLVCAALGAQIVPGVPAASKNAVGLTYKHARWARASLHDQRVFEKQITVDAFRNTPGGKLLSGLRGKDVVVSFVESYGRSALQDPRLAPQVGAVLEDGNRRLRAAGFASRSAFLTSPTAGGGSWLAHATLLSGLWIDNQRRYDTLVSSDRMTLNRAFQRASWRSVAVVPGVSRAWSEAAFFGYDQVYDRWHLGYRGPRFGFASMPDQYTLSTFHRLERAKPGHAPVMTEIPLVSSHAPWAPLPRMIGWNELGDGSVFGPIAKAGKKRSEVWPDHGRVRTEYRRSIEYSLNSLISYVEKYGGDDLVLVFVGDHQPFRLVTGEGATRDVPITIVARDKAVLDRISGWGWHDGLRPGPRAPVWPMSAFRDRFLTAFGR